MPEEEREDARRKILLEVYPNDPNKVERILEAMKQWPPANKKDAQKVAEKNGKPAKPIVPHGEQVRAVARALREYVGRTNAEVVKGYHSKVGAVLIENAIRIWHPHFVEMGWIHSGRSEIISKFAKAGLLEKVHFDFEVERGAKGSKDPFAKKPKSMPTISIRFKSKKMAEEIHSELQKTAPVDAEEAKRLAELKRLLG